MSNEVNVAVIVERTEVEGPGLRYALWVQGCPMRCRGCCNPEMLAFTPNLSRTVDAIVDEATSAGVEGVTFLGGEPFAQAAALAEVGRRVRAAGLSVMVFSGYTLTELRSMPEASALLSNTDLLVDGRYDATKRTTARRWVGSSNQELQFLTRRYDPSDSRFAEPNHLEIRLRGGVVSLNGWPVVGAKTRIGR